MSSDISIDLYSVQSPMGHINIVSDPQGARIYIDGFDTFAITPYVIYNLTPGLHTYELELDGYYIFRGVVNILQDQIVDMYPSSLIREIGSILFNTYPQGASVSIDDIDIGYTTPLHIVNIPTGEHIYILRLSGYNDYIGPINVHTNGIARVDVTLVPREGCVSFESSPSGAELIIEGIGRKFTTPVIVCDLPLRKLEYHLKLSGYKSFEGCTTLNPGQGENIAHTLMMKTGEGEE